MLVTGIHALRYFSDDPDYLKLIHASMSLLLAERMETRFFENLAMAVGFALRFYLEGIAEIIACTIMVILLLSLINTSQPKSEEKQIYWRGKPLPEYINEKVAKSLNWNLMWKS